MSYIENTKKVASNKFYMLKIDGGICLNYINEYLGRVSQYSTWYYTYECKIQKNLNPQSLSFIYDSFTYSFKRKPDDSFIIENQDVLDGTDFYYCYNYIDGTLKFCSRWFLEDYAVDAFAIMFEYSLHFTSGTGKYAKELLSEGKEVYWQSRISDGANLGFSQENNLSGLLSISESTINLANSDFYFNDFFSQYDSFSNRAVTCWRCIDGVENHSVEWIGSLRGADLNGNNITFNVSDILVTLDRVYYAGKTPKTFRDFADGTYIISENDKSRPIYRLIGKNGPYEIFPKKGTDLVFDGLETSKMTPLTCVSWNETKNTSNNRKWSIGFGPSTVAEITFTIQSVVVTTGNNSIIYFPVEVESKFSVGDTVRIGTVYTIVVGIGSNFLIVRQTAVFSAGQILTRTKLPAIIVSTGNGIFYPMAIRDYSVSLGSKGDVQITFTNNFEGTLSIGTALDPDSHQVHGRLWNDEFDNRASQVAKLVLTDANMPVATHFMPNQFNAWPDVPVSFTVPFVGQEDFPSYSDVMQAILGSACSIIYYDDHGFIRYKSLVDYVQPLNGVINQSGQDVNEALTKETSKDFSSSFDFYDIYSDIYLKFTHGPQAWSNAFLGSIDKSNSILIRSLYRTNKVAESDSIVANVDNTPTVIREFFERYYSLITGRRSSYQISSFSRHFNFWIGDDIAIDREEFFGHKRTPARIMSISKKEGESTFKFMDLKFIPR